MNQTIHWQSIS